jgi:hypothetical protein
VDVGLILGPEDHAIEHEIRGRNLGGRRGLLTAAAFRSRNNQKKNAHRLESSHIL